MIKNRIFIQYSLYFIANYQSFKVVIPIKCYSEQLTLYLISCYNSVKVHDIQKTEVTLFIKSKSFGDIYFHILPIFILII